MDTSDEIQKWKTYQVRTENNKPRPLLVEALKYVQDKNIALDLGAGALNDTEYLLKSGFKEVTAVDITKQFREITIPAKSKLLYIQTRFNEYEFPSDYFNIISAQYALPFLKKEDFKKVWTHIRDALKTGGIFTGQFFGTRDDWFEKSEMVFHSQNEVSELVREFDIIKQEEREYTEQDERKKHWHYFDLILRK